MSEKSLPGEGQYWYNVQTGGIEHGPQSDWSALLGPYPTEEAARGAMDKVRARNEEWDEEEDADD
ncbi:SPOR domain-containing protein [Glutamicibacter endophyticus]|uniref:SPOR domain-containing protein n=1 Tax=Glutamicibacter endophyticus TaxID=1522174 RepID=UPI003AF08AF1